MFLTSNTYVIGNKSYFTHIHINKNDDWFEWFPDEENILDEMHSCDKYGTSKFIPKGARVLIQDWTYLIKNYGQKKAQNQCNVSLIDKYNTKCARTHAACAIQLGM